MDQRRTFEEAIVVKKIGPKGPTAEESLAAYFGLSYRRLCILLTVLEMAKMIANTIFQTAVGWWHTWSFSADFENPDIFYPILLMPIRAISWMDVGFSILFLLASALSLGGLLKDHEALLKPCIRSLLPFLLWRLLVIIFYICVAAIRHREMFLLYHGTTALAFYIFLWIFCWIPDVLLFRALRAQYKRYKRGTGHLMDEVIHEL